MIKLEIDYWKLATIARENPDNYNILRSVQPSLPTLEDIKANKGFMSFEAFINDIEQLPDFIYEVASFRPIKPLKLLVDGRINSTSLKDALAIHQVHLPGNELLRIHEVCVEEDCCTDRLQTMLTAGWRIIAVCPQPSRRPDYILGRL